MLEFQAQKRPMLTICRMVLTMATQRAGIGLDGATRIMWMRMANVDANHVRELVGMHTVTRMRKLKFPNVELWQMQRP